MNAIILSGGRGLRMGGIEKAFLTLGKETLVERKLRLLEPLFDSVIIVANEPALYARLGVRVVTDQREGLGPLMGLYSGLLASDVDASFVTTVDTPLLQKELVGYLVENARGWDALVPRWSNAVEPLCAVYSRRCLPAMEKVLDQGKRSVVSSNGKRSVDPPMGRIVAFYPYVRVRFVAESVVRRLDPSGLSFLNVNTPGDLETVRKVNNDARQVELRAEGA